MYLHDKTHLLPGFVMLLFLFASFYLHRFILLCLVPRTILLYMLSPNNNRLNGFCVKSVLNKSNITPHYMCFVVLISFWCASHIRWIRIILIWNEWKWHMNRYYLLILIHTCASVHFDLLLSEGKCWLAHQAMANATMFFFSWVNRKWQEGEKKVLEMPESSFTYPKNDAVPWNTLSSEAKHCFYCFSCLSFYLARFY